MDRPSQPGTERKLRRYKDVLSRHLPILQKRFQVRYLGLFGSYIQGTPRKNSDLDILVEFSDRPSLFEFIELEGYLSDLLDVKVDLVIKDTLKPLIGRWILREVVGLRHANASFSITLSVSKRPRSISTVNPFLLRGLTRVARSCERSRQSRMCEDSQGRFTSSSVWS
jgi:predicted nucleotidyltransferase